MKLCARVLFISLLAFHAGLEADGQATIFFYNSPREIRSEAVEITDGMNSIGTLSGREILRYSSPAGIKAFTMRYGRKTDEIKLSVQDGGFYFVEGSVMSNLPKLKVNDFQSATKSLPAALSDSLESVMISEVGVRRVATIKLNSLGIQNLNPITRNDSLLFRGSRLPLRWRPWRPPLPSVRRVTQKSRLNIST